MGAKREEKEADGQKKSKGIQKDPKWNQKGTKRVPNGTKREPIGTKGNQKGAKGSQKGPEDPKLEPKGLQKTTNRPGHKHKVTKCRKVENWRDSKVNILIFQSFYNKTDHPQEIRENLSKKRQKLMVET